MIEHAVILAIASPNHVSGLTRSRPHAMLPALGKPMVVRVMNQLFLEGIKKFVVVVGINEGSVASYLNTSWVPNVEIDFVLKSGYESLSTLLGQIARKLNRPFFVVNYNTFTQPQFIPTALNLYTQNPNNLILAGTDATLSKSAHDAYARVENNKIVAISDTATDSDSEYLIANMAVCGHHFVEFVSNLPQKMGTGSLQRQFIDILRIYAEVQHANITLGRTAWIMQVNSDPDLMLLNYQLLDDGRDAHILSEVPSSVQINPPVRIDPGVSIGQGAVIGPHVYLEAGSSVGMGAKVRRTILLDRARIAPNTVVDDVVIAPNKIIPSQLN